LQSFDEINAQHRLAEGTKKDPRWAENPTWPISIHDVRPDLNDWINSVFVPLLGVRVATHYMIIRQSEIHNIHRDAARIMSFNYIIHAGGDVVTRMFDDDKNLVDSCSIEERRWCQLRVDGFHDIQFNTYTGPRFSVIVTTPKSIDYIKLD